MGDPKKQRKSFSKPRHLWHVERIEREEEIARKYGLKNRKDLWKMETLLRSFRRRARKLLAQKTAQAELEKKQLIERLVALNILKKDTGLDDVLTLKIEDLLERRLQTIVNKSGLANRPKQARQFIVHGHVTVGGNKVTSPSYMVKASEENTIKLRSSIK
jgi:small subunit ribosomal protein S4